MASINNKITNLVAGDTWKFERTYSSLPTETTINKVYFTIKDNPNDADVGAILQVSITSTLAATGQITDDMTTPDGIIIFNLIVSSSLSALLNTEKSYFYDFQGIASDGAIYTFETGTIRALQGYTSATS